MARQKFHQGIYKPDNPQKYIGDATIIAFRSSWEYRFMRWCDTSPNVSSWSSEEIVIPYFSALDQRWHRYFVDFMIVVATRDGEKKYLIEIKPREEIEKPKPTRSKYYQSRCETWIKNQEKWNAAREWARQNSCEFVIMDEYDLGLKKRG